MTSTDQSSESTSPMQRALGVDMKLEVVTLPVSDVDRAKSFYQSLGWRLDADFAFGDDIRSAYGAGRFRHRHSARGPR
jgi:catechol 2,3-dioxygenase-like lactoylglutathione lyase family enzyme